MKAGISGLSGPERARKHGAHVRRGHRLRRRIAGVPVILVPRVQNEAQVADAVRADQRAAIHDLRDVLQTLRDLDVIDHRVDTREGAEHALDGKPGSKGV